MFKALLVLHNMIRSGGTDNVLEYLARMDVLRLKSVGQGGFWEGQSHLRGGRWRRWKARTRADVHPLRTLCLLPVPTLPPALSGYSQTETLTYYAHYLHARITAYRELKHDMVRVQSENNRASAYRTHSEGASGESLGRLSRGAARCGERQKGEGN